MNTFLPTTLKSRGYYATSRPDGRWLVKGRGMRRVCTFEELQYLLNPPKKARAS
ncbi:hypothetical protein QTI51_09500 [Variovorax sp. J22G73]|uniref:hypothetical protein n=1 Tax=unclassified Variovorax TaxID=663243 RepID=UPI0025753F5C|nr:MULTISPECIES: hypothetical protein [unclassified Variovorax]MDM0006466.1 hypothetical protein [Variovorax sp. J22R203]MDM0097511.1 hypothetical protein [Variovorax sp. J22G73]